MLLQIQAHLAYDLPEPIDILMQIEVAELADQQILSQSLGTSPTEHFSRVSAEAAIGARIWVRAVAEFRCDYTVRVKVDRPEPDLTALSAVPAHRLPGDAVRYLMPSRFCPSDEFQTFVADEFGARQGGDRIAAMRDWIYGAFTYVPGSSNAQTTALDTFVQRRGVCRDFAHVLITMARASGIPARYASVYAPGVTPPDFHAVAEVFLDGAWHLVDPTGMATADSIARIGVGMDAAEVAFLSAFGQIDLVATSVSVLRQDG